jgi:S-adenosylmethionine decarboxylase
MMDLTGFFVDAHDGAELTMNLMRESVQRSSAREVHHTSVVLGDDGLSPPGFTSCVLIDESHVTAHCYSEKGWLAIDVFTCGSNPNMPMEMAEYIKNGLLNAVPSLVLQNYFSTPRFLHDCDGNDGVK